MTPPPRHCLVLVLLVITAWVTAACAPARVAAPVPTGANKSLSQHSRLFRRGVVRVTDNVWVAIGWGIANSVMIEGDDGLIIVDTMTTTEEAAAVLAEFRKISPKPVKAIIYTHSHPDHVLGAGAFADGPVRIYAHRTTLELVKNLLTETRPVIGMRSARMYGLPLPPGEVFNVGIGPFVGIGPQATVDFLEPTNTFDDSLTDTVAGVRFTLFHAPGETSDQIVVWLPGQKLLVAADNFYWCFPNLYTIRGTPFRSLRDWYQSLDLMRGLKADSLVPCHGRPIAGRDRIFKILTDYRDAIQYVHDQSIRAMNLGMTPDEMAQSIRLPPHLAEAPYLQPFYGKVSWAVRSMFSGYLGWFDGDSASLEPLGRMERARLLARLAGGADSLRSQTQALLAERDYQAVLELSGHLLRLDPGDRDARKLRIEALTALGQGEQNASARNYYLTEAWELGRGGVVRQKARVTPETLRCLDLASIFNLLAVRLDPEASAQVNQVVTMIFPGTEEAFSIHVRHGVAEIQALDPEVAASTACAIRAKADAQNFKEMLAGMRSPLATLAGFEYDQGSALEMAGFLKLFQAPPPKLPVLQTGQKFD
jgi:alkyl sulfatase BDS1-like metallo-beta-lactamase superfamily hydrolase